MRNKYLLLMILALLGSQQSISAQEIHPFHYTSVKTLSVEHGAVASAQPLASEVGALVLRQGGNAVDAAVAAMWALAVVYPEAGNIGGGGFMVLHLRGGKNTTIDFREKAPGKASPNMYLDKNGNASPELSQNGALSVGVPGTVAGIFLAHHLYGKLPMSRLIQPAIELADKGFALSSAEADQLNEDQEAFRRYNTVLPVFIKKTGWHAGDTLRQKDLAHTLTLIREQGQAGFYGGETSERIVSEMGRSHGILSSTDLKDYRAIERPPAQFNFEGYTVVTMPLPSSGGILLEQMLGMLKNYSVGPLGFESSRSVQLMTEIERRAYADRARYLGDPDFVKVPIKKLVSESYLKKRMSDYHPGMASPSSGITAGEIFPEDDETTHLSVADSLGNAVSVTYTLNNLFGSKVVVGHAGFFLNDEMDDFSAKPGSPNMFGLLGSKANAIAPAKRMLSSMTPTIVLKNGRPYLVLGTPGGATIITSVFQTLVDLLCFHMKMTEAVNQPKFHMQWKPDVVYVERGFPDSVIQSMSRMGYTFKARGSIGRTEVIRLNSGEIEAVADSRGDDGVAGY